MKHTDTTFAPSYSPFGNFQSTTVFIGSTPITRPRFLRGHPEVRVLSSPGVARLHRYYDPLRVPAEPPSLTRALEPYLHSGWSSPNCPDHSPCLPCPLPRWTRSGARVGCFPVGVASPYLRRVGVHDFTFEACSGFTRVTALRVARPPEVAFVTRLRPGPLPHRAACQLPDLPTTIWVGLSPTSDLRLWGALKYSG
jgi:hypothetical protein